MGHCNAMGDRFAILDSAEVVGTDRALDVKLLSYTNPDNVLPDTSKNAAFYFPWIEVIDPAKQLQDQDPVRNIPAKHRGKIYVPPSGHVAGIYARVDEQRGVHKAPGNEAVIGALDVKYYIGKAKQELLNPQGVNCIRNLNGNIRVYGARTIGGDKNGEFKYINVRRTLSLRERVDRRRNPVGGFRTQRHCAVGKNQAQRDRFPHHCVAGRSAVWSLTFGSLLREVRRRDESSGGP